MEHRYCQSSSPIPTAVDTVEFESVRIILLLENSYLPNSQIIDESTVVVQPNNNYVPCQPTQVFPEFLLQHIPFVGHTSYLQTSHELPKLNSRLPSRITVIPTPPLSCGQLLHPARVDNAPQTHQVSDCSACRPACCRIGLLQGCPPPGS
jgi:hypothetical protein